MTMRKPSLSILGLVLVLIACLALPSALASGKKHHFKKRPNLPVNLEPGQALTHKIWADVRFVFEGKAGEVVTLKVTGKAPGVDPHVTLLDPESKREAFDDDSGGHGNSLIKDHTLKQSGRYTAVVGVAGSDEGEVEVLLEKAGR